MKIKNRGQSIIEVIVALAITGLIAIGIVKVTSTSVKSSRYSTDETKATQIAEKIIAENRNESESDPDNFWLRVNTGIGIIPADIDSQFCPLVVLLNNKSDLPTDMPDFANANMAQITVYVFWDLKDSGSASCSSLGNGNANYSHKIQLDSYVTN